MLRMVISSIAIAIAACGQAIAADPPLWVRVEVNMDGARKNELESCLLKRLRGIQNLSITDKRQASSIILVAIETKPVKGFVASYIFTKPILDNMLSDEVKKYDSTLDFARDYVQIESNRLIATNDIGTLCKTVASDYDVIVVEPFRKLVSMMYPTK